MKNRLVLGLSGYYHDCSFCLVDQSGKLILHCELERDARIKEIPGNPILYYLDDVYTEKFDHLISGIATFLHQDSITIFKELQQINFDINGIYVRSFLASPYKSLSESLERRIRNILEPIGVHANMIVTSRHISRFIELMARNLTFDIFGHHHCHAAEAYFRCGSPDALIVTADGGGFDFSIQDGAPIETHLTAWNGVTGEELRCIDQDHVTSLGSVYAFTTSCLGFSNCYPVGSQNGSVMGMAAYGNASKYKHLYEDDYLFQSTSQANPHRQHVFESREKLRYTIYSILEASKNSLQDKFDIAASLQDAFEARFTEYTKNLLNKPELKTKKIIVFSGGASLNCAFIGKINTELRSSGTCKFVNVSNVPYDGGLSIGSALLAVNKHFDAQPATSFSDPAVFSPYLGREYTELDCISALRSLRQEYEQLKDTALLYRSLAEGKVIAIFNGRSESGRRALGNRSLFADPRIKDIRDIMNQKVKHRPIWRPFAPVILEEDISDWFTSYTKSPYMSHTCQFKSDMKSRVASVVHADGTGRLQTVSSKQNIWLYSFLSGWKSFSGIPILINTSFNDNEPIVESPYHAVSCFQRTNIDILFFPEYFLVAYK